MWAEGDIELQSRTNDGLGCFMSHPTRVSSYVLLQVIVDALPWRDRVYTLYS